MKMMTGKIKNLITELTNECQKEEVVLSLQAFDKENMGSVAQVGNAIDLTFSIFAQSKNLEKLLSECDCENCQKEREDDSKHEYHEVSSDFMADVMDRIAKGEFD